jgi:hypothetical protein
LKSKKEGSHRSSLTILWKEGNQEKKQERRQVVGKWMAEIILLKETIQAQKSKCGMFLPIFET